MTTLTQQRVRELFNYNPVTGVLTRRVRVSNTSIGDVAGSLKASGYLTIQIDCVHYYAHVVVWLWMTGHSPRGEIDHRTTGASWGEVGGRLLSPLDA